jgi:hypothetical protein
VSDHVSVEELADAAEGLLDPARAEVVRAHVAGCPACQETAGFLTAVSATLAAEPTPAMPAPVIARLDAVIAQEQARRGIKTDVPASAGGGSAGRGTAVASEIGADVLAWKPRPRLPDSAPTGPHRGRAAGWVLFAAAAATLVGFGGYVVSARAGLNEPPSGAAAVSSGELPQQAGELRRERDIDPHRFSRAWMCARQVTDGRITGIASVTVDGSPALLVYLGGDEGQRVSVVEGCDDGAPRVTATTRLTR